jgi:CRISPR system Cascade subunit CasC
MLKGLVQGGQDKNHPLRLKQPVLFGKPEADYFVRVVTESAQGEGKPVDMLKDRLKKEKNNLRALCRAAGLHDLAVGLEGALFGRFVTSDILARSDAAVHVAHAFTVHPLDTEVDYFTVVDDLKDDFEDAGAAHAGDMELGAGIFYGYVVVDIPLLVSNLTGCDRNTWLEQTEDAKTGAREVLVRLVETIATVSPGAKLGATAPYAWSALVLLETGEAQPRTLANAFLKALRLDRDPLQQAVDALGEHLQSLDGMYGCNETRFVASIQSTDALPAATRGPLDETTARALDSIFNGAA